ncbi:hypothetical protein TRFO_16267 [Tritrichomonas foetus]|uniref:Stealth protein CR2 conserved region 2 domain-containing protein n=1 Tax=Tritrichomonas foetus TaxID=1144522 RepID=A0A1J4KQD4_9EUKA|nr:hypothetical protein TRFO_16267 [Tritrichomonas foetus]|eukprot:OHT13513.1 hypothetical protein TRFO_16267 [Tritrichomonas foetus]
MKSRKSFLSKIHFFRAVWCTLLFLLVAFIAYKKIATQPTMNFHLDSFESVFFGNHIKFNENAHGTSPNDQIKVDLVYTWVDGLDENFIKLFDEYLSENQIPIDKNGYSIRYEDIEELRYSLRTAEKFLKFINKIFIITIDGKPPIWLNTMNPRIIMVSHEQIFRHNNLAVSNHKNDEKDQKINNETFSQVFNILNSVKLPTFNSNAIELGLVNIPGLSEHFIYFNDDCFVGRKLEIGDFFDKDGNPIMSAEYFDFNYPDIFYRSEQKKTRIRRVRNSALFLSTVYGTAITIKNKYKRIKNEKSAHVAIPLTKSILIKAILDFPEKVSETLQHRYRDIDDLQLSTFLHQVALINNMATSIMSDNHRSTFVFIDNDHPYQVGLNSILLNKPMLFCINVDIQEANIHVKKFLEAFVSDISQFENPNYPPQFEEKKVSPHTRKKAHVHRKL